MRLLIYGIKYKLIIWLCERVFIASPSLCDLKGHAQV